jgi:transposase
MSWRRGQTYSQDLRDRVLNAEGSARQVAERFGVSVSYVVKARQRRDRFGATTPRPQKPPVARLLVHLHEAIAAEIARRPETTIAEMRDWLQRQHGVLAGMGTVWKTLSRLGLTLKKSRCARPNRRAPTLPRRAAPGAPCVLGLSLRSSSFSMRPGPRRT